MKRRMYGLFLFMACALAAPRPAPARAASGAGGKAGTVAAVDRFRGAYELLVLGDEARDAGSVDEAIRLYRDALGLYLTLSREYPDWQPDVTRFRISYCDSQLEVLLRRLEEQSMKDAENNGAPPAPAATAEPVAEPADDPFETEPVARTSDIESVRAEARRVLAGDEPARARLLLLKGLEIAPDDPGVRTLMGILHCRLGEHAHAMHLMEQLVEEQPSNAVARVVLGSAYFGVGRVKDAETQMKKAIAADPGLAAAHFDLAHILLRLSPANAKAAALHYRKALDLGCDADAGLERELKKAATADGDDAWDAPVGVSVPTD